MENYVGKRLDGRYEIMEIIGVGGMAVVYKAFDNIDQRVVAVKILKDEFIANEEFKRRFKNESKAIAVLSHENIVRVFDVSYGDMLQYIVMEYVDGITLKEYMQQQGKVDPREAIYFVTQILRALQHAHDKGIVHRDVKPQNIMLQSDGSIKVTDFGIARFSRGETKTMTDCAIGSVHYISPEQAKGNLTDSKTDLYAVGVILYEMLTGSLPFQSDNAVSVALMQLQKDPVMPRELNSDIAIGLEQIIMKAMQKNVADRYQSASEMLFDIDRFKRNPNIKFNYFFATTGANAAIDENSNVPLNVIENQPQRPARQRPPVKPHPANDSKDDSGDMDDKAKKRTIITLSGVLIALMVFAAILITAFSGGNKNTVEVPLLEGLNYYNDIINNTAYSSFKIVPSFREDSQETAGMVLEQEPKHGKHVEIGSEITVYIAGTATGIEIPKDIIGKNFSVVETELKALGFDVKSLKEKNEKATVGSVIRTVPQVGEKAPAGSTVTIYVATNKDVEPVDVPDLLGLTVSQAKSALEKVGLSLNLNDSEYRNSTVTAGLIIGYEKVGEQVLPGTSIAVYVSNGRAAATSSEETTGTTAATTAQTTATPTTEPDYEEPTYDSGSEDSTYVPDDITVTIFIPTEPVTEAPTTYPEEDEEPTEDYEEPSDESYDNPSDESETQESGE